jgi:hypothetical protein
MLKATVDGLKRLRQPDEVARTRGLTIAQVLPVVIAPAESAPEEAEAEPAAEAVGEA